MIKVGKTYKVKHKLKEGDWVRANETIKVVEHTKDSYKIVNIDLGTEEAWLWLTEEEIRYILDI